MIRTVEATEAALCQRLGAIVVEAYRALPGGVNEPDYEAELADVAVTYAETAASPMAEGLVEGEAGFRMLAVDVARQGGGAGRALVEACIARAVAAGRDALCLHTTPWMPAVHALYESLGFERDPARDWRPLPEVPLLGYRFELRDRP